MRGATQEAGNLLFAGYPNGGAVSVGQRLLGYVPNAMAQGLKTQRTNTVSALVSDMAKPLYGEFLSAAEEHLRTAGYLLVVANTHRRTV